MAARPRLPSFGHQIGLCLLSKMTDHEDPDGEPNGIISADSAT
jgi:hypothetical protein